jgi:5-formyltetrahydrofolate cyclo-ligase
MKKMRNLFGDEFINKASIIINHRFLSEYQHLNSFAIYYEINNEVKTSGLIKQLLLDKKMVYLPIYRKDMVGFGLCTNLEGLITTKMGLKEPPLPTDVSEVDVIVVPGLAFDKACFRLGYGVGYYDRVLKKVQTKCKVGFAYEFQILDELPFELHDVPVDTIITEKNTYRRK